MKVLFMIIALAFASTADAEGVFEFDAMQCSKLSGQYAVSEESMKVGDIATLRDCASFMRKTREDEAAQTRNLKVYDRLYNTYPTGK